MNKLFVYGIFLGERQRLRYGMSNPEYATVAGYLTMGNQIVEAIAVPERPDIALSGLVVDVEPSQWERLDRLEGGYKRITITTTDKQQAWMYAGKE